MPGRKNASFRATANPAALISNTQSRRSQVRPAVRPLGRMLPLFSVWLVLVLLFGWLSGLFANFSSAAPTNAPFHLTLAQASPAPTLALPAGFSSLEATPEPTATIVYHATATPLPATPAPAPTATAAVSPTFTPVPRPSLDAVMQDAIDKYKPTLGKSAEFAVVVHNLDTGEKFALNSQQVFETASLYKLFVMLAVYSNIDQGKLSLDDSLTLTSAAASADEDGGSLIVPIGGSLPVRDLLNAMITRSNNTAALMLLFKVGIQQLEQLVGDKGFNGADLSDSYNYRATAEDFDQFMERVANSTLLGPKYDPAMLDLLLHQITRDRIPSLLPAGTRVANKTGNLSDIVNDTGLVFLPNGQRLAITVLVHRTTDVMAARKFTGQLSLAAYNFFA